MVPEFVKVVTAETVAVELLIPEIVPALVRVVMLERVEVVGRVIVAPELLVRVVGLMVGVAPVAKAMVPEFVIVPVMEIAEAA